MISGRVPKYDSGHLIVEHGMRLNGDVYTSKQMVLNHHRYSITNDQMSHVQYVIQKDDRMTDGKLLSNDIMLLMANQSLLTSISNINITSSIP